MPGAILSVVFVCLGSFFFSLWTRLGKEMASLEFISLFIQPLHCVALMTGGCCGLCSWLFLNPDSVGKLWFDFNFCCS